MFPSLNGRRFRSLTEVDRGDVDPATVFEYYEANGVVHATYSGGNIERGFLVGTRAVDRLDFRYAHLRSDGTTATGHCVSVIAREADGRLRLDETWEWESVFGKGTSSVVEIAEDDGMADNDEVSVDDVDPEDLSLLDLLR